MLNTFSSIYWGVKFPRKLENKRLAKVLENKRFAKRAREFWKLNAPRSNVHYSKLKHFNLIRQALLLDGKTLQ